MIQAEQLVSSEHGILAGVVTLVNVGAFTLNNYLRRRKRNGSLRHEVTPIVEEEVVRIMALRAWQDAAAKTNATRDVDDLKEDVLDLRQEQRGTAAEIQNIGKDIAGIREGIIRVLAASNPDALKYLDFGGRTK